MSTEQNKASARRGFEEIWNQGNLAVVDELTSPDYAGHFFLPGMASGVEGFKQFVMLYRSAFPDVHFTVDDIVAEGDRVATRWTATGTHTGQLMNIPPTGKKVTVTGMTLTRYNAEGKGVEGWANFDQLGMLQQLGVVPAPG
jgi:steroid delta-isomerase-like uncharacterized protein